MERRERERYWDTKRREGGKDTGRGGRMQDKEMRTEEERKDVETQRRMDGGRRDGW